MEEFGRLHGVIQSNKLSNAHWERNISQYTHHVESLLNQFTSIEALFWTLLVRNIDARGWELHLRGPESSGNQTEYFSHGDNLFKPANLKSWRLLMLWWRERRWNWKRGI